MSEYLSLFLDELDEQLQILDAELLVLERDGVQTETIQRIFRAAHTLKGSSAAMGFEQIKDLTHWLENVFDHIRNEQIEVTPPMMTVIFDSVDCLKGLYRDIAMDQLGQTDVAPVINQLKEIELQVQTQPVHSNERLDRQRVSPDERLASMDEFQKEAVIQAQQLGYEVMTVYARMNADVEMKSARAWMVYHTCQELGEVIAANPPVEMIQEESQFQGELVFILVTSLKQQEVLDKLRQISQIDQLEVRAIASNLTDRGDLGLHEEVEISVHDEGKKVEQAIEPKVKPNQTIRVDVNRLEQLLNYVGELIIDNTRLQEVNNRLLGQFKDHQDLQLLNEISSHLNRVIGELQEGMMKTRMLPIEQLFNRFPRMVRDMAESLNKEIDFIIEGKETELDRTLIEEISDPIIHLLRNSADHGIESPEERVRAGKPRRGKLLLKAVHQENQIIISIADDGRGIDSQKLKSKAISKGFITREEAERMSAHELVSLIFRSGMSTAETVTDLSGRGVGMDIVRAKIEKLNGLIDIETSPGEGTVFTIKLPLTLAINRSLLVKINRNTYAIPLVNVIETVRLNPEAISTIQGQEVCIIRGTVFSLIRVSQKLHLNRKSDAGESRNNSIFVVIVGVADQRVCLVVDHMIGNQEIVIKSLGSFLGAVPYIAGATILGDGNVALILDVGSFVRDVGSKLLQRESGEGTRLESDNERQIVTFRLAAEQYALEIDQVREIITVPTISRIATAPSHIMGMINLRGKLVPMFNLHQCLNLPESHLDPSSRIIVVERAGTEFGILVDQVTEVLKLQRNEMAAPPPQVMSSGSRIIRGVYRMEDRFIYLLGMEDMIQTSDIQQIQHQ